VIRLFGEREENVRYDFVKLNEVRGGRKGKRMKGRGNGMEGGGGTMNEEGGRKEEGGRRKRKGKGKGKEKGKGKVEKVTTRAFHSSRNRNFVNGKLPSLDTLVNMEITKI
jgi:hypothetical protein